ncbi:voltage-gated hydrogen channel 1 [Petromyzon marinus]|uniref:voltage-gated hydrogen channel 1 n=1 Tax=Petromyzon marinus TaxID=7757 RepID=UPI003F6F4ACC
MERYLQYFSTLGDPPRSPGDDENEAIVSEESDDVEQSVLQPPPSSFRESLKRILTSERFQVAVVCLVLLDAGLVMGELIIDLSIIKTHKDSVAPEVLHYMSLAILSLFMVELAVKLFAFRLEFFWHPLEVLDGAVVAISFALDIFYASRHDGFDATAFLILLRLWRIARIANGIVMSVKNRTGRRVAVLKREKEALQRRCLEQEQELEHLRSLVQQHGIKWQRPCQTRC